MTSPGKELLVRVMEKNAPCLILIDEWVALLRQLPDEGGLAASLWGKYYLCSSLTEAAKAVKGALVIASLPVSSIEVGGTRGEQALQELSNVVKRVANHGICKLSEGFGLFGEDYLRMTWITRPEMLYPRHSVKCTRTRRRSFHLNAEKHSM